MTSVIETVAARLTCYPTAQLPDGRRAEVSDGFHTAAELAAGAAIRVHRGVDITWHRKQTLSKGALIPDKPFGSRGYLAPKNRHDRPILAAGAGVVAYVTNEWHDYGKLTGAAVYVDHGEVLIDGRPRRLLTGYHHMEMNCLAVAISDQVKAGELLGIMGATPPAWGAARAITPFLPDALVHLHLDLFHRPPLKPGAADDAFAKLGGPPPPGVYLDGQPYVSRLRQPTLVEVWGAAVRVGPPGDELVGV